METILLKILEVQNEILAELRLLRQAVAHGQTPVAAAPQPSVAPAAPSAPEGRSATSPFLATPPAAPIADAPPAPSIADAQPAPSFVDAPPAPPKREQPGGLLTFNDLADLSSDFLEPGQRTRGRVKTVDASDLSGSILEDIKAKNKAKRNAFAEFDKFNRDR
ncbi:MAG: hypothetical protein AB9872_08860 [Solidesulfovibrio sp.]